MNRFVREAALIVGLVLAFLVLSCASAYAIDDVKGDSPETVVDRSETNVTVRTSPTNELDALCGGSNAKVDAGGFGAAFPSYPCETVRTDLALERIEGRTGFRASSTRAFLNARLFMRGISSVLFGLFGLG